MMLKGTGLGNKIPLILSLRFEKYDSSTCLLGSLLGYAVFANSRHSHV